MLRLCNELHGGSPDPPARKRRLLEGLRKLTGADHASATVAAFPAGRGARRESEPAVISLVHAGAGGGGSGGGSSAAPDHDGAAWATYRRLRPPGRRRRPEAAGLPAADFCTAAPMSRAAAAARNRAGGHRVYSFLPLADGRLVACLTLGRAPGAPRFSPRDRSMVCALHAEAGWVYGADMIHVSPDTRALSPRLLEVLTHLLTGKSEKQVAAAMRVSYNTLHHHVKSLYRHFDVTSRVELLARWVGK